ncbi:MAG: hypothetical protein JXB85_15025 [Anaerolineales bacterium]|nr:hypothetical protein [Anaerolineales bacterium]
MEIAFSLLGGPTSTLSRLLVAFEKKTATHVPPTSIPREKGLAGIADRSPIRPQPRYLAPPLDPGIQPGRHEHPARPAAQQARVGQEVLDGADVKRTIHKHLNTLANRLEITLRGT